MFVICTGFFDGGLGDSTLSPWIRADSVCRGLNNCFFGLVVAVSDLTLEWSLELIRFKLLAEVDFIIFLSRSAESTLDRDLLCNVVREIPSLY